MHQSRILGRAEALLRHPQSNATNLASAAGEWFNLEPRFRDERHDVAALALTLAAPGLLSNCSSIAGTSVVLEVAIEVDDGYGRVRDVTSVVPHHTAAAHEWSRGTHQGTVCDAAAGRRLDGSARAGLRGEPLPAFTASAPPVSVRWTGPIVRLRHGQSIVACSWEIDPVGDAAGAVQAPPTIELAMGQVGAGGVSTMGAFSVVAQSAADIARGFVDLGAPLAGDLFRWRVTLPYLDPGVAAAVGEQVHRTAVVFRLCAWISLAQSRWRFTSLAQVIERSELARHFQVAGWDGTADVALLRVPLDAILRGGRGERVRARITGDPGSTPLVIEAHAIADLRHDSAEA